MKKQFGLYATAWFLFFAVFQVVAFLPFGLTTQEKYTTMFWIGYSLITAMFIGQLICALMAFRADSAKKFFYNLSLILTSYIGLIISFIFGGLCMAIVPVPYWVGAIVCAIILVFNVVAVIKATAAITEVERVDENVKEKTFFIKTLTVDAARLTAQAKSEEITAECKKVYEAIRYSDPMSNSALASVEAQITIQFHALCDAVEADDSELVKATAANLTVLLADRNEKCKLLK